MEVTHTTSLNTNTEYLLYAKQSFVDFKKNLPLPTIVYTRQQRTSVKERILTTFRQNMKTHIVTQDTYCHTIHILSHNKHIVTQDTYCHTRLILSHKTHIVTQDAYCHTRHILTHKAHIVTQDPYCHTRHILSHKRNI